MRNLKITLRVLLILSISMNFIGCDNDNNPTNNICEENYVTNAITTAFTTGTYYDDIPDLMDVEIQEYEIQINANGEICSIGYEAPSAYLLGEYEMRITINGSPAYDGVHMFSQNFLYQPLNNGVVIVVSSGDIIKVSRKTVALNSISETVGRVLVRSDWSEILFPITVGNVTFLSSRLYGESGSWAAVFGNNVYSIEDKAIPYIGLGFKVY